MKHISVYSIILLSVIQVACTRESYVLDTSKEMFFTASISKGDNPSNTKSADAPTVIPIGDGMTLTIEESDIDDNFEEVATKGKVVTTENFSDLIDRAGRMHITAYDKSAESSAPFTSDYFKYDGQYWRPLQSAYWPSFKMDIYAFTRPLICNFPRYEDDPQDIYYFDAEWLDYYGIRLLHDIDVVNRTLNYYNDGGGENGSEDLLFAKAESAPNHTGPLNLSFKHILTAVKFVTSSGIPSGTVKNISIGGLYMGYATFHFDTEEWEFEGESEYCYEGYTVPGISYEYYYNDDRDWGYEHYLNVETTAGVAGAPISNEFQTLFVYPQKCRKDSFISIDFQHDGETEVRTYDIPLPDGFEFKKGKQITFSIGSQNSDYTFYLTEGGFTDIDLSKCSSNCADVSVESIHWGSPEIDYSAPWKIASYQIGSNGPVEVNAEEANTGDLLLKRNGNKLQVTDNRILVNQPTHEYWAGSNGDWSPAPYAGETIDLSKFNAKTEAVNAYSMTTANCYIIRHAGSYKLPLVYGNAVVNGVENVEAYYPAVNDTGGAHSYSCRNFPNYNDTPISSAFIENNDGCIPTGCAILWQDNGEIISNLEIVGTDIGEISASNKYDAGTVRYLQFKVDQSTIHQGNALICIYKDKNTNGSCDKGEEIWFWHIWVTNNPALLEPDIQIKPYSLSSKNIEFFPIYCLGWIDPGTCLAADDVTVTLVQEESLSTVSFVVHRPEMLASRSHGTYYRYGKNRPYKEYFNISETSFENAWTGYNIDLSQGHLNDEFIKTIYDPSPAGYVLPNNEFQKYQIAPGYITYTVTTQKMDFVISADRYGVVITDKEGRSIFFPETNSSHELLFGDDLPCGLYLGSLEYNPALLFHNGRYCDLYPHSGDLAVDYFSSAYLGAVRPIKR